MEGVKCPVKTKQEGLKGTAIYHHREARTEQNPKWRWWKFWVKKFLYFKSGYYLSYKICSTIESENAPSWDIRTKK